MEQLTERNDAIEIEGRRFAWRTVGEGPPLVLINGYSATSEGWDPRFVAALAGSFSVICPDNRGMGRSQMGTLEQPLTADSMAADVEALLDAEGIDSLPVAGWSMGGFVAQTLAARAPERVQSLALLSTNPGGSSSVFADPADIAKLVDHSGTAREQASRLLSVLFPPGVAEAMDAAVGDLVAEARAALDPEALQAQQAAMAAWVAGEPARPDIDPPLPVLVACGEEDVIIPAANAEPLAARWPGARIERFAGCGHAFMAQEPERLAKLIASFAQEHAAG